MTQNLLHPKFAHHTKIPTVSSTESNQRKSVESAFHSNPSKSHSIGDREMYVNDRVGNLFYRF
ncbi:MAG: hypothetical protein DWQ34_07125 [Planctomycetota bacterium]|nr:MAG: hypothetical protein DWQ34_07125 [Planctomycetota bacterium]REK23456.1 MAG: hypothetical protein DWQ41_17045 [Planctomycetota bacterium]REK38904.1 MAG: hypothetical protein DWQ45_03410 [Planctomycetota bacterium]